MPDFKIGDRVKIKGQKSPPGKVTRINYKTSKARVKFPDGSYQIVLISLLIKHVATPFFQVIGNLLTGLAKRVKRWANK